MLQSPLGKYKPTFREECVPEEMIHMDAKSQQVECSVRLKRLQYSGQLGEK